MTNSECRRRIKFESAKITGIPLQFELHPVEFFLHCGCLVGLLKPNQGSILFAARHGMFAHRADDVDGDFE